MAKKSKKNRGCLGAIFWLVSGTFLGLGIAASIAIYINQLHIPFTKTPTIDPDISSQDSRQKAEEEILDFHNTLQRPRAKPFKEETKESEEQSSHRFVFYLQLGSFSQLKSAEALRGEMALEGYTANLNTDKTANDDTLYRVWLGPFNNRDEADFNCEKDPSCR